MKPELARHIESTKRINRCKDAMKELIDSTNCMNGHDDMVEGMLLGLMHSHRTLQQSFVRVFIDVMSEYSEVGTDLRNEGAVAFAKKVKEMEIYLPNV